MSKERSIAARIAIFALSQVGSAVIATARSRAEEMVQQSNLEKYTLDLTAAAKAGELDPVVGRDAEIGNVISVLNRFTGNNPLLVGEPGVGKTSIIQGLAQRIADEDCPSGMKGLQIFIVQNSVLMSGAVGGELTRRISGLLYELQNKNAVLFIEDLGVILEKGGYELQEVLKSSLSSGCLRVVASCAVSDQTKLKDGGLGTRFQVVEIKEPSPSEAARMLRVHAAKLEAYHGVRISDAAIIDSAKLSDRYMSAKKLPEKAIGLLDQAACLLKIIMQTKPGRIESLERKKTLLLADYEAAKGTDKDKIAESLRQHTAELEELNARWALEQETVERYRKVEEELQKANAALTEVTAQADLSQMAVLQNGVIPPIKARLKELNEELQKIQKDGPLVRDEVTSADIAHVLAKETGIPVDQMMGEELERLQNMEKIIAERIIGQKKAVEAIAAAIRCSRAGLQSETKPVGSFLFPGPTGVGKTEIAKAFAEFLFGSEKSMIRFDMSEFKEPHSVALMLGSPPGYQGSDQGGKLTEAIRQQPYSVLLFDEVEKAHPDIFNILLALLDDGRLTDARGITVDCRNVIVIMTTNIGSKIIQEAEDLESPDFVQKMDEALMKFFRPELLNRLDAKIMFHKLDRTHLAQILKIKVNQLKKKLAERQLSLNISQEALDLICERGYDPANGARPIERAIKSTLKDRLTNLLVSNKIKAGDTVEVTVKDGEISL